MKNTNALTVKRTIYIGENPDQNEPLVAVLVGPAGPCELWVLGDEQGKVSKGDLAFGQTWVDRLASIDAHADR
jgi:hypothetical protein